MARIALRLRDLGVVEIPMEDRETLDQLSKGLRGLRDFQDNSGFKCLFLLSPPVVRKKGKNHELLTSHARFVLGYSTLGDDMPITVVGDEFDAAKEEELRTISKNLETFLLQHLRGLLSRNDLPTTVVPDIQAEQPAEPRSKKSRPTEARRRRIAAGQICPVCRRIRGKEVPVNSPKTWKKYIAAGGEPSTRGPGPVLSCKSCGFVLGVSIQELTRYNAGENRLSMSDLLRPGEHPCPSCGRTTYDRLSAGVARGTVCEGRLRRKGEHTCDFAKTLSPPAANADASR